MILKVIINIFELIVRILFLPVWIIILIFAVITKGEFSVGWNKQKKVNNDKN